MMASFMNISNMSLRELNDLAATFNIQPNLPRNAKVNAVCQCLDISTCAGMTSMLTPWSNVHLSTDQLSYLKSLTPRVLFGITEWSTSFQNLPSLDDSTVKQYLLDTEMLDCRSARTYKLSRPYQLQPFIHSVMITELHHLNFCVVKALCNPSQSTKEDDMKVVHVVLDTKTGHPCIAYCTCTVG